MGRLGVQTSSDSVPGWVSEYQKVEREQRKMVNGPDAAPKGKERPCCDTPAPAPRPAHVESSTQQKKRKADTAFPTSNSSNSALGASFVSPPTHVKQKRTLVEQTSGGAPSFSNQSAARTSRKRQSGQDRLLQRDKEELRKRLEKTNRNNQRHA